MFQNGVNRKLDSKSLDACVGIQVLLRTNGDRPGNNYLRSVSPSIPALLPKIPNWFFFQVSLMLCTYIRTFLQNNDLLFQTQVINRDLKRLRNKAFIHDMLQIYGRNWIRFDQNEKNLALFVVASWKKIKIFYYFSRLYLHTFFPDFSQVWKIAENCCSVRTLSFVRGISLHNLRLYTPVVRATSVPTWGWIFIFVTIQIWVVLLIGWSKFWTNQKYYPDLGSDAPLVWNFCARFSDAIWRGNQLKGGRKFRSLS